MSEWIDTHCHLDAPEFSADLGRVRERAAAGGVARCVLPAVCAGNFDAVRLLAQTTGDSYALGIHPLYVAQASEADLSSLDQHLQRQRADPRLVAVGEIGLDFFVPGLCLGPARERQEYFYLEQLKLARKHELPVLLHVRRSADRLLKGLRSQAAGKAWRGIAHAFNGSEQQARAFIALGLKLGFGGAFTFERALQLRRLASALPLEAIVLETDAPDMPPRWLYQSAGQRDAGAPRGRNEPGELPRIGAELAALRGMSTLELARATSRNAMAALPRLALDACFT
ncbi:MAG: TatD family hydrolase [Rhodoferax sp.]